MILPGIGSIAAGLGKSAPEIRGTVQSASNTEWEDEGWSPDLAAHEAGDVLVVIVGAYMDKEEEPDISVSSGWTVVDERSNADRRYQAILSRTAVNSSTALTLTNNQSIGGSDAPQLVGMVHSYACRFANGSVDAGVQGSSRNPPSLTPPWGAENNLWIVAAMGVGTAPSSSPSGFSAGTQTTISTAHLSTAHLEADVPTLDPGAFQGSAASGDICHTIAVRPA